MNLGQYQDAVVAKLEDWFDDLWDRARPYDLAAVFDRLMAEYSPYLIFLRVLEQLYGAELEAEIEATGEIPITTFQQHGVWRALQIIHECGGMLLSATPVNNSLWDLYYALRFFVKQDAKFADRGVLSIKDLFQEAERDRRQKRKVLIFSFFTDTVDWIVEFLEEQIETDSRLAMLRGRVASVSGDDVRKGIRRDDAVSGFAPVSTDAPPRLSGSTSWTSAVSGFAPVSTDAPPDFGDRYDVLISTDVLAEGMNLQQCRNIINYDLPWNPMRLVQRHGRIDRIGSPHKQVFLRTFFPDDELNRLLRLEGRFGNGERFSPRSFLLCAGRQTRLSAVHSIRRRWFGGRDRRRDGNLPAVDGCEESTERVMPDDLKQTAWSASERARRNIHAAWIHQTDPKNLQPKVSRFCRELAEFLRENQPPGGDQPRFERGLDAVEAPVSRREENAMRATMKSSFDDDRSRAEAIIEEVERIGLEPYVPSDPLPPVNLDEIHLVSWMAINSNPILRTYPKTPRRPKAMQPGRRRQRGFRIGTKPSGLRPQPNADKEVMIFGAEEICAPYKTFASSAESVGGFSTVSGLWDRDPRVFRDVSAVPIVTVSFRGDFHCSFFSNGAAPRLPSLSGGFPPR